MTEQSSTILHLLLLAYSIYDSDINEKVKKCLSVADFLEFAYTSLKMKSASFQCTSVPTVLLKKLDALSDTLLRR